MQFPLQPRKALLKKITTNHQQSMLDLFTSCPLLPVMSFSFTFVSFSLTSFALRVVLWFTQVTLLFHFATKALSCRYLRPGCWASGHADILSHFSPLFATETQAHLQTPALLSCLSQTPARTCGQVEVGVLVPVAISEHSPLFYVTNQLGPDNSRKRG